MKSVLIETANDEELKMVEAFIKEHKMKDLSLKTVRRQNRIFNDIIRILIPIA